MVLGMERLTADWDQADLMLALLARADLSRAERAYKKLDVHNRADAVDRARSLQVLP